MLGSITRASARQGYDLLISFQQLSRDWQPGLRRQPQGRRHHPAGLRRLRGIPAAPRRAGRTGHALRALGAGAHGRARRLRGLATMRQGGYDVTRHLLAAGPQGHRVPGHGHQPLSGVLRSLPRLRARHDGSRRRHLLRLAGGRHHHRGIRISGRAASCVRAASSSTPSSPPAISSPSARCARCRNPASTCRARWPSWASTTFRPQASPIRR